MKTIAGSEISSANFVSCVYGKKWNRDEEQQHAPERRDESETQKISTEPIGLVGRLRELARECCRDAEIRDDRDEPRQREDDRQLPERLDAQVRGGEPQREQTDREHDDLTNELDHRC